MTERSIAERDDFVRATAAAFLALCVSAFTALSAGAQEPPHVYDGITAEELAAFAERQGWTADTRSAGAVEIDLGDARAFVELHTCDEAGRCRSGVIRTISYHFVEPTRHGFWHWNLENHGATGYGPSYVTLERYLHFAGVTDLYLREVIGEVWPKASREFWGMVEELRESE